MMYISAHISMGNGYVGTHYAGLPAIDFRVQRISEFKQLLEGFVYTWYRLQGRVYGYRYGTYIIKIS